MEPSRSACATCAGSTSLSTCQPGGIAQRPGSRRRTWSSTRRSLPNAAKATAKRRHGRVARSGAFPQKARRCTRSLGASLRPGGPARLCARPGTALLHRAQAGRHDSRQHAIDFGKCGPPQGVVVPAVNDQVTQHQVLEADWEGRPDVLDLRACVRPYAFTSQHTSAHHACDAARQLVAGRESKPRGAEYWRVVALPVRACTSRNVWTRPCSRMATSNGARPEKSCGGQSAGSTAAGSPRHPAYRRTHGPMPLRQYIRSPRHFLRSKCPFGRNVGAGARSRLKHDHREAVHIAGGALGRAGQHFGRRPGPAAHERRDGVLNMGRAYAQLKRDRNLWRVRKRRRVKL